ncbi:tumor necrosis factor receptor superfamily member 6 isoform X2 [Rhineura floridana]|uniref:tumor necrosis factor receptor superfamily member 6 isoform X2 n=1 Tax=Rhineura floridana TaxID=261503 RepID=UPI002AC84CCC|nr:tumor necrosis factor receptor superfamily member 6 isoform X2 [Rhineura floridana]
MHSRILALDLIAPGSSHNSDSVPVTHRAYKKLAAVKNVSKRDVPVCQNYTQYVFGNICCDACKPGFVAKTKGCTKDTKTDCKTCTDGQEYMDKYNFITKCLRCGHCDTQHGLEVEKNCTINQNIKCRCRPDFFCNSSEPCSHCNPCDKCEHGIIVENCTRTKNTKCKKKEDSQQHFGTPAIVAIVVTAVGTCIVLIWIIWKYVIKKRKKSKFTIRDDPRQKEIEMEHLNYPDIDLLPHISEIAELMTLQEVKALARKLNVPHIRIDAIMNDNLNDSTEQKIKLLEYWYQEKGIQDAYRTLISTLRSLNYHATADKIKQKIEDIL